MRIVGPLVAMLGTALLNSTLRQEEGSSALPLWAGVPIALVAVVLGWTVFWLGRKVRIRARRHLTPVITSFEQLRTVSYVLYLRPFVLDRSLARSPDDAPGWWTRSPLELPWLTEEDFLVRQFARLGRVVAIGEPGERLPLLGAERGYLPLDDWQGTVSELIEGAHVVMLSAAPGPGTVWEFTEALRTVAPTRLVLLIYTGPEVYDAFRVAAARAYGDRSGRPAVAAVPAPGWPAMPELPDWPEPGPRRKGLGWEFPLRGVVSFDQHWNATFTRFDPVVPRLRWFRTVRRLLDRELEPMIGPLSGLPVRSGRIS
ncbi:hypothetical protein OOK31_24485 [Streptomyces sp. NBC_00249]|nr:hypothetical protein [Streptomyces sp. NBC_00249]